MCAKIYGRGERCETLTILVHITGSQELAPPEITSRPSEHFVLRPLGGGFFYSDLAVCGVLPSCRASARPLLFVFQRPGRPGRGYGGSSAWLPSGGPPAKALSPFSQAGRHEKVFLGRRRRRLPRRRLRSDRRRGSLVVPS